MMFQFAGGSRLDKRIEFILLTPLFAAAMSLFFVALGPADKFLILAILAILGLSVVNLRFGFLLILFLRPVLDLTVNHVLFHIGSLNINVLGAFGVALIFLAITIPFRDESEVRRLHGSGMLYAWLLFLAIGASTLLFSFYPSESVKELLRFLSIFSAFIFGALMMTTPRELTTLIKVIIWSALPPAVLALGQLLNDTGLPEGLVYRVFGSMTHPNMLAFYLLLAVSLCLFLLLSLKRTRLEVYLYSVLGLFYAAMLFFTYTRGAYLALLIILFFVGAVRFKKFLLVSFISLLLVYILVPPLQGRFNSIFQQDPYGSFSWRLSLWRDGYSYFNERLLQGYGLGTAEQVIAANRDFRLGSPDPHNDFLRVALDGGLPLLAAYLFLGASLVWFSLKSYLAESRPKLKSLLLFFTAMSTALYLASAGDNIINDTALQWQWWALAGALFACVKRRPDLE